jgi:hypothetical protein
VYYKVVADNYEDYTGSATVTINKRTVTMKALDQEIIYGDQISQDSKYYELSKTAASEGAGGDVTESALAEGDTAEVMFVADQNTNRIIPVLTIKDGSGTDVTSNYDITLVYGVLTVNPRGIEDAVITLADDSLEYNGKEQSPDITKVMLGNKELTKDDYEITSGNKGTVPDDYTLVITGKGNYMGSANTGWKITNCSMAGISAESVNVEYDGKAHGITVTGYPEGATVTYGTSETSCTLENSPTYIDNGRNTVYYKITADNYIDYTGSATVIISKRTVTAKALDQEIIYGDQISQDSKYYELSKTKASEGAGGDVTESALAEGDTEEVILNTDQRTNKITPALTIKNSSGTDVTSNYEITLVTGDLTVNPRSIEGAEITLEDDSFDYSGEEQSPVITKVMLGEKELTTDDYMITSGNTGTALGAYTLVITGKGNYTGTASVDWKINAVKTTLIVKADNKTRTYGSDNPTFTYTVTGLTENDMPEDVLTGSLVCAADKYSNAGDTYGITQGVLTIAEQYKQYYDLEFTGGTLTIIKASQGAPEKGRGYEINDMTITVDNTSTHKVLTNDSRAVDYGTKYELFEYDGSTYTMGESFTISTDKTYYVRWGGGTNYNPSAYTQIDTEAGVTVMAAQSVMGKVASEGLTDGKCRIGSSVTVKAVPNDGYEFISWQDVNGNSVSSESSYTFKVEGDTVLKAAFKEKDKKIATLPKTTNYEYDGTEKTGVEGYEESNPTGSASGAGCILNGTFKAEDAGTYIITAKLADGYDQWSDGTAGEKKMSWSISKNSQAAPTVTVDERNVSVTIPAGRTVKYSSDMTIAKAQWTTATEVMADMAPGTYYFYTEGDSNCFDSPITIVTVSRPAISALTIKPSMLMNDSVVLNGAVEPKDYINGTYIETVKFMYREKEASEWNYTDSLELANTFSKEITGLKENTDYEYMTEVKVKGVTEPVYGDIVSFHTLNAANTGRVDVLISDDNEVKRELTVSIEAGNNVIAAFEPDNDSKVSFTNLPDGYYNVVVSSKDGDYTETRMVTVNSDSTANIEFHVPAGKISSSVSIKNTDNTDPASKHVLSIAVNGMDSILSPSDIDNAASGSEEVGVAVEFEEKSEQSVEGAEDIIKLFDEEEKVGVTFFDISLFKTVKVLDSDGNPTSIDKQDIGSKNTSVLEIAIPYVLSETKKLKMYRYHNGIASELSELDERPTVYVDGTYYIDSNAGCIFLYASTFSTYAIAESEKQAESTPEPSKTPVTPTESPAPSAKPTGTPVKPTESPAPSAKPTGTPVKPTESPAPSAKPTGTPATATESPAPSTNPTDNPGIATESPAPSVNPTDNPVTATNVPATTAPATAKPTKTEAPSVDVVATPVPTKKPIKITSVTCVAGKKVITGTVSVKKATIKIKVGKNKYKKATIKGKKFTLKLGYKLKKKMKVVIKVSKKDRIGVKKTYKVK